MGEPPTGGSLLGLAAAATIPPLTGASEDITSSSALDLTFFTLESGS